MKLLWFPAGKNGALPVLRKTNEQSNTREGEKDEDSLEEEEKDKRRSVCPAG